MVEALLKIFRQRHYSSVPRPAISESLPIKRIPHVTILRPVKGIEPNLYECLAATFRQTYPRERLTIYFCISSRTDPAYPTLEQLLSDFPDFDARILVEEEDANLFETAGKRPNLGPNPKIRNLSRGYREAKGDLIWILDCNVWIGKGVAGRMVDRLCGYVQGITLSRKYKFVHQLPLVVDVAREGLAGEGAALLEDAGEQLQVSSTSTTSHDLPSQAHHSGQYSAIFHNGGGRLEELFLASSHAKFYTAINTVLAAPCIVGKSNMFRRSHLDQLTASKAHRRPGIDFFSDNICEDHLIGDLLWKQKVPEEKAGQTWGKHGLVFGDLAIQPMAGMSVREYIARRVRWLRVRKFTVTLATFVEPGTESFLCSLYGAYAVTTLPWFQHTIGIPHTWAAFFIFWIWSVSIWSLVDWTVYLKLHSASTIELDGNVPPFARPPTARARRPYMEWLFAWLGRESLALPIWSWAFWGGTEVVWRGTRFRVGMDMKVHEVDGQKGTIANGHGRPQRTKVRDE